MRLKQTIIVLLIIAIVLLAAVFDALAQIPCGKREAVVEHLTSAGYKRRALHVSEDGRYIDEFFAYARTGHWIIIRTATNGLACRTKSGSGWRADWPT